MNNKQAIIDKIINDAKLQAQDSINIAQSKVEAVIKDANEKAQEYIFSNNHKAKKASEEILKRAKTIEIVDKRKLVASAKMQVVDSAYARALEKFRAQKSYVKFIETQLLKYAESGDFVAIAQKDSNLITKALIDTVASKLKIDLNLQEEFIDIQGGVILVGKKYDKNLSLDILIEQLREDIQQDVVNILFEENAK